MSAARLHTPIRSTVLLGAWACAVALTLTGCTGGTTQTTTSGESPQSPPSTSTSSTTSASPTTETTPVGAKLDQVKAATLLVEAEGRRSVPGRSDEFATSWWGSAFVVTADGLAVTNSHVIAGAGVLNVHLTDEDRTVPARVLTSSPCSDLAVLQLDGGQFTALTWHEGTVAEGLDVYSAGFPRVNGAPRQYTLTRGIISKSSFRDDSAWASVASVFEHDARIRGGNSGGPLVDAQGAVVGVNYANTVDDDANFAIDSALASTMVERAHAGEQVASIGISASIWVPEDAERGYVWVEAVEPGSPAAAAGVEAADIVMDLAGISVGEDATMAAFCDVVGSHTAEETVDITVYRPRTKTYLHGQLNGAAIADDAETRADASESAEGSGVDPSLKSIASDSGTVAMSVPSAWDTDTSPRGNDDSLVAAPDLDSFPSTSNSPGVSVVAQPSEDVTIEALEEYHVRPYYMACDVTKDEVQFDTGGISGTWASFHCGPTIAKIWVGHTRAGTPIAVFMQLTEEDWQDGVGDDIFDSITVVP